MLGPGQDREAAGGEVPGILGTLHPPGSGRVPSCTSQPQRGSVPPAPLQTTGLGAKPGTALETPAEPRCAPSLSVLWPSLSPGDSVKAHEQKAKEA